MNNPIKIDFVAPISQTFGVSICSRRILSSLSNIENLDIKVFGFDGNLNNTISSDEAASIMRMINKPDRIPDITIQYVLPPMFTPRTDAYNIGIVTWETNKLPFMDLDIGNGIHPAINNWCKQISKMNEIWTFSEYCKNAIETSLKSVGLPVPKIEIIFPPLDTNIWKPSVKESDLSVIGVTHGLDGPVKQKKFIIGTVGEWNDRKDLESFIAICMVSVDPRDCVIVMKTRNHITGEKVNDLVREQKEKIAGIPVPPIIVIDSDLSEEDMAKLYRHFDVYVSTSKGEGFNMPLVEAMSLGKKVIVGNHSAHSEIVSNSREGTLVSCTPELVRTSKKNPWFQPYQVWHKPNEIETVKEIQNTYIEWKKNGPKINEAAHKATLKFSETKFREKIRGLLSSIKPVRMDK